MRLRNGERNNWKKNKNKAENQLIILFYLTKFRFCRIFVVSIGVKINKNNIIQ